MNIAKAIRDVVLPLVAVETVGNVQVFKGFKGTCFLIGESGKGVTCSHVTATSAGMQLCALSVHADGYWVAHQVTAVETHPTEDVAVLQLEGVSWGSFLIISADWEGSCMEYMQWAYPEEVVNELDEGGSVTPRPDLVYLQGYIRRRLSRTLHGIKGNNFYELSEPGTLGCSGSPIIKRTGGDLWDVVGIFAASRVSQSEGDGRVGVGYCVRIDAITPWLNERTS